MYAAKDLLDHVDAIGFDRRYCVAILVGHGCVYSAGCFELVGCVSQRLVLAQFCNKVSTSFRGASGRRGISLRLSIQPSRGSSLRSVDLNVHRERNDDRSTGQWLPQSTLWHVLRLSPPSR